MKHLARYATLESRWARIAVVAGHLPLILFIAALHVLETSLRGVTSLGTHVFAGLGNSVQDFWEHLFNGLASLIREAVKVIQGT